jgi:hypothetical protein
VTFLPRSAFQLAGALGFILAQFAAQGATMVLTPSKDNTLYEDVAGGLSNGKGDSLYVGKTGENDGFHIRRGLIAFDLSAIPPGSTINSVTLSMFVVKKAPNPAASSVDVSLHLALKDWGEGTSIGGGAGAPAQPGDATWLHNFYDTSFWTTPGGDFRASVSAIRTVTGAGQSYSWVGGSLNGDVQAWVNNPASNFGWFIRGAEFLNQSAIRIVSGDAGGNRPQLTVIYMIPEPSAVAFLGVGAVAAASRRQRRLSLPR